MPFIHYFYVFLWAVLAVLCFFIGRKHGLVGYLLTVFFLFMSVWYGLEAFGGLPVFDGVMGHFSSGTAAERLSSIPGTRPFLTRRTATVSTARTAARKTEPHIDAEHIRATRYCCSAAKLRKTVLFLKKRLIFSLLYAKITLV